MIRTRKDVKGIVATIAGFAAAAGAHAAAPGWWDGTAKKGWITNMPDFYQHQAAQDDPTIPFPYPAGNPTGPQADTRVAWQWGGGWCAGVAVLDVMYNWSTRDASLNNLIRDGDIRMDAAKWINPMRNNIAYNAFNGALSGTGVNAWLDTLGYGASAALLGDPSLQYAELRVAQDGGDKGKVIFQSHRGATTVKIPKIADNTQKRDATAFDFMQAQMLAGRTANLRIGAKNAPAPNSVLWWKGANIYGGNYHLVAAAGLDASTVTDTKFNGKIWFSDPDSNKGSKTENAGAEWVSRTIGTTTKDELKVPAARKYNATDDPKRPVAERDPDNARLLKAGFDKYYGFFQLEDDGFTVKSSDAGANGKMRYEKTTITAVGIMNPVTAAKAPGSRAASDGGSVASMFSITNSTGALVDQVMIFPDSQVDSTHERVFMDPYDLSAPMGGAVYDIEEFSFEPVLHPGQNLMLPLLTAGAVNFFDVFLHDSETNTWFASANASDGSLDVVYDLQVPTPGGMALVGVSLALVVRRRRA